MSTDNELKNAKDITCSVCKNIDMKIYYKSFNAIIYYCEECCHFKGNIFENCHNINIFKDDINKFKYEITSDEFYKQYYNINSYFILDLKDFHKIVKYSSFNPIIYFMCDSISNIKNSKKGEYDFFSTNSIKYYASMLSFDLMNVYVLKNSNKTIYEFIPMKMSLHYNLSKNIFETLYHEIINDVYL